MATDNKALINVIYEAIRFANWAAGEGITPTADEDATDPATFLFDFLRSEDVEDEEEIANYVQHRITTALSTGDSR